MDKVQAQITQRQELARYSRGELESLTVPELRKMAKGLFAVSRLNKKKLIDSILVATQSERQLLEIASKKIPLLPSPKQKPQVITESLSEWLPRFYEDLKRVALEDSEKGQLTQKIYADISSMVDRLSRFLHRQSQYGQPRALTTIARERSLVASQLREMIANEAAHQQLLLAAYEELLHQLAIRFADVSYYKKGLQERQLAERKESRDDSPELAKIDFQPFYEFAQATLKEIDTLLPRDWKQVVVALVIVTGRRPAEIQNSSTQFELVTQTQLTEFEMRLPTLKVNAPIQRLCWFTGQLKEKGMARKFYALEPCYVIPTLVEASLVVQAHDWLQDHGKVVDSPSQANKRYSKDLSDYYKALRRSWGIDNDLVTNKGLRSIYAQVCNHLYNNSNPDNVLFLAKILGHSRADLIAQDGEGYRIKNTARLTDMLTPQSYNSDFVVDGWQCAVPC